MGEFGFIYEPLRRTYLSFYVYRICENALEALEIGARKKEAPNRACSRSRRQTAQSNRTQPTLPVRGARLKFYFD